MNRPFRSIPATPPSDRDSDSTYAPSVARHTPIHSSPAPTHPSSSSKRTTRRRAAQRALFHLSTLSQERDNHLDLSTAKLRYTVARQDYYEQRSVSALAALEQADALLDRAIAAEDRQGLDDHQGRDRDTDRDHSPPPPRRMTAKPRFKLPVRARYNDGTASTAIPAASGLGSLSLPPVPVRNAPPPPRMSLRRKFDEIFGGGDEELRAQARADETPASLLRTSAAASLLRTPPRSSVKRARPSTPAAPVRTITSLSRVQVEEEEVKEDHDPVDSSEWPTSPFYSPITPTRPAVPSGPALPVLDISDSSPDTLTLDIPILTLMARHPGAITKVVLKFV